VRLSGPPFDGLPQRPAIAAHITQGAIWRHGTLQLNVFALDDYQFELHIPDLPEAVALILTEVASSHQLSDKGKLGKAWQDNTDTQPLLQPGVFEVITQLTTPRSRDMLRELRRLQGEGAVTEDLAALAASWGGRVERRHRSADQIQRMDQADAVRVLEQLCALGWAERGLQISCGTCGLRSFIRFPQATGRAICPGCKYASRYETDRALTIRYRLDSYLDLLSDQGVLPQLMAATVLAQRGKYSYFLPGLDVTTDDGNSAEADLFGILDGQILAGEVKTSAAWFTDGQLDRDTQLTQRLRADTHVLAAMDNIPAQTVRAAQERCDALGLQLIVLQRADLRP
jgi:hypothetical protein